MVLPTRYMWILLSYVGLWPSSQGPCSVLTIEYGTEQSLAWIEKRTQAYHHDLY